MEKREIMRHWTERGASPAATFCMITCNSQLDLECRPGHLVTAGVLVGQACKSFTIGSGLRLSPHHRGPHHNSKFIQWEFPEYSPPYISVLFKTVHVKIQYSLQGETKLND